MARFPIRSNCIVQCDSQGYDVSVPLRAWGLDVSLVCNGLLYVTNYYHPLLTEEVYIAVNLLEVLCFPICKMSFAKRVSKRTTRSTKARSKTAERRLDDDRESSMSELDDDEIVNDSQEDVMDVDLDDDEERRRQFEKLSLQLYGKVLTDSTANPPVPRMPETLLSESSVKPTPMTTTVISQEVPRLTSIDLNKVRAYRDRISTLVASNFAFDHWHMQMLKLPLRHT